MERQLKASCCEESDRDLVPNGFQAADLHLKGNEADRIYPAASAVCLPACKAWMWTRVYSQVKSIDSHSGRKLKIRGAKGCCGRDVLFFSIIIFLYDIFDQPGSISAFYLTS